MSGDGRGVHKGGTGRGHVAFLSAVETASFLETFLSFFQGELSWFLLGVYVHGIGIPRGDSPRSRGMESDGGSRRVLFCDGGCKSLSTKELVDFLVPSFGHGGNHFHPVNSVRKPDQDSSSEVVDNGGSVGSGVEFCFDNFELEFSHVLWEVVVISDMGVGEPGGGFSGGVGALEGCLEVFNKI